MVTKSSYGSEQTIDVLMPAQARYSAWQGSLSIDTRPLGLDAGAMTELFDMQDFSYWREQGGIIMSSALGREGVRRFYDPANKTFPAFEIARDAFLAGNDILFLDDFVLDKSEDQFDTAVATIQLFVRKYREDAAFAERVDRAVERIIAIKMRLYDDDLSILNITDGSLLFGFEADEGQVFQVAQEAVTLLSPSKTEFISRVPRGPSPLDRIVIFTDSRIYSPCSVCKEQVNPPVRALEKSIERLYGFGGISQNSTLELFSFSFVDLYQYVMDVNVQSDISSIENNGEVDSADVLIRAEKNNEIDNALLGSDWLVFAVGDMQEGINNNALKLLLTERPDLLAGRKIIVFAMGAPYYLDATDVSQTTAYYGLYGESDPFIEVAARVLFQEIVPHEAPPVSIDSVSYDLQANLAPYPDQLFFVTPLQDVGESDTSDNALVNSVSGEDTELSGDIPTGVVALTEIIQGSTVNLQTSMLMDHNSKNVPDGTIVEFDASYLAEGGITETFAISKTVSGVAIGTLVVDRMGLVEIRARSADAVSEPLQFDVLMGSSELEVVGEEISESASVGSIIETTIPIEATSTRDILTAIVAVSTTIPESANQEVAVVDGSDELAESIHIDPRDLMSAILAMIVISTIGWSFASMRGMVPLLKSRVRLILFVTVGVWAGYDYYALRLPVPELLLNFVGLAPALLAWAGGFVGLLVGTVSPDKWSLDSVRSRKLGSKGSNNS
jgi:beta-N-acetylhexosaminidase